MTVRGRDRIEQAKAPKGNRAIRMKRERLYLASYRIKQSEQGALRIKRMEPNCPELKES